MELNSKVVALIKEYQKTVLESVILLNKKYKEDPDFYKPKEDDDFRRIGFLDRNETIKYSFHGTNGCLVEWENGKNIDFNLGVGGRCDGFDPWFVYDFFENNKDVFDRYAPLTIDEIRQAVSSLIEEDKLRFNDGFDLYYFFEDYNNLAPYKWIANIGSIEFN